MPKVTKTRSTSSRNNPVDKSKQSIGGRKQTRAASKIPAGEVTVPTEPISEVRTPKPTDAPEDTADNYLLLVRLTSSDDPTITRLLSVPSTYSFLQLHKIIQIAFGWAGCHAFHFTGRRTAEGELDVDKGWFPRGKEVLSLQMTKDQVEIMSDVFNDPDVDVKACADCTLKDAYENEKYESLEMEYEYDHGDSWIHEIIFLGKELKNVRKAMAIPPQLKVVCMAGEGHPCAEDCGGEPGWEDLKRVFKGRKADSRKNWYKTSCANGDPKGLDPYRWDMMEVNHALSELFST
ncbi:hypothetical protein BOTCAL_0024g00450 [Botryotinia calthae]|uniref:Plasmid pRiA4b Orf3-like domain-containing protein n=1 Tax=Botryotinia calthae TaxID=38488 RepID=A0A4Y8DGZ9_9HELO|nr:hypothetical protein BOTCAL_0024g00450 [Botryotinia calthae]